MKRELKIMLGVGLISIILDIVVGFKKYRAESRPAKRMLAVVGCAFSVVETVLSATIALQDAE